MKMRHSGLSLGSDSKSNDFRGFSPYVMSMIKYDVNCSNGHRFEGWFRDSATFEAQAASGEIACPICGDTVVTRALMTPAIGRSNEVKAAEAAQMMAQMRKAVTEVRTKVEAECDPVGDKFAEEARKIHYGESEKRGIYGTATAEEAAGLHDEGIAFGMIPDLPKEDA